MNDLDKMKKIIENNKKIRDLESDIDSHIDELERIKSSLVQNLSALFSILCFWLALFGITYLVFGTFRSVLIAVVSFCTVNYLCFFRNEFLKSRKERLENE